MGKRGPQPQPLELRKLRGNPGKKAMPNVPKAKAFAPACPDDLGHLRVSWDYYAGLLSGLGILRETDAMAFETMFRVYDQIRDETGRIDMNATRVLITLMDRFGLSPTSRSALVVDGPKEKDEFSEWRTRQKAVQ